MVKEAVIVAAKRTAVGKAPRGMFRNVRPDDLLAHAQAVEGRSLEEVDAFFEGGVVGRGDLKNAARIRAVEGEASKRDASPGSEAR